MAVATSQSGSTVNPREAALIAVAHGAAMMRCLMHWLPIAMPASWHTIGTLWGPGGQASGCWRRGDFRNSHL